MSAISLASMQPVHRLSHCLECSWCFYKPPWVQCTVVALNVWGLGGIYRHIFIFEIQTCFHLHFWDANFCFWVGFCHVNTLAHTRFKFKTQRDLYFKLQIGEFWSQLFQFFLLISISNYFIFVFFVFLVWQEWGRKKHALRTVVWYFQMC